MNKRHAMLPTGDACAIDGRARHPARSRWRVWLLALAPLWCIDISAASVMVTDVEGRVDRSDRQLVAILQSLNSGTELRLAPSSRVVLMDLSSGREYVLKGPGRFSVEGSGVRLREGPDAAMEERALPISSLPPVKASARIALAAVRMRSGPMGCSEILETRPRPLQPDLTAIPASARTLRWTSMPGTTVYQVSLQAASGEILATTFTGDAEWRLPTAVPLSSGRSYSWRVEPSVPSGNTAMSSRTASFTVISDSTAELLRALAPSPDDSLSRRVLYAAQLQEAGALMEACEEWKRISEQRPGDPSVLRLVR